MKSFTSTGSKCTNFPFNRVGSTVQETQETTGKETNCSKICGEEEEEELGQETDTALAVYYYAIYKHCSTYASVYGITQSAMCERNTIRQNCFNIVFSFSD